MEIQGVFPLACIISKQDFTFVFRANFRNPVQVLATEESIAQSPIALFSDTVIIVHGLEANAFSSLNEPVKNGKYHKILYITIVILVHGFP